MTNDNVVRFFVENRSEELIVAGIFADFIRDGRLAVRMCWTASSAISLAETWLLTTTDTPVALALNCVADPGEFRIPVENILSRAAPGERWHVAVAVPDMSTWLLEDLKFAESVTKSLATVQPPSKSDIAVFFKEWANQPGNQFDRGAVSGINTEFEALNSFVERHALQVADT